MNVKVHDTIGVSPAELLFGQAINLYSGFISAVPPEVFIRGLDNAAPGRLFNFVAKLVKAQHTLIQAFVDYCREKSYLLWFSVTWH
jgi:hypothetical protein